MHQQNEIILYHKKKENNFSTRKRTAKFWCTEHFRIRREKMGKIPNLYATIGYSSSALKSMLETETSLAHDSSFIAKEREAINLIVSQVNECDYCLAVHTTLAKMRGFTEKDTLEIRKGGFQRKN